MKNKPLLFIILGIIHLVEPIFKLLYFKATTHFPMHLIIENISQMSGAREVFEFWFLKKRSNGSDENAKSNKSEQSESLAVDPNQNR